MKFKDIKKFIQANNHLDVSWLDLKDKLQQYQNMFWVNMSPPYQRWYVWTKYQKEKYLEFILRWGTGWLDIYWNCPNYRDYSSLEEMKQSPMELVDWKQRISTVLDFLDNKIKAFWCYYKDYVDKWYLGTIHFHFHTNTLKNQLDVVEWYLSMNTWGSIHTEEDLKTAYSYKKSIS